jgi:hypothetical protein
VVAIWQRVWHCGFTELDSQSLFVNWPTPWSFAGLSPSRPRCSILEVGPQ